MEVLKTTGKITKIKKSHRDQYAIYINHTFSFYLSEDVLVNHHLSKGMMIDEKLLFQITENEKQSKANSYALKLLSYRSRSEQEIIKKMKEKGYEEDIINNTLSMLKEYNYINDEDFSCSFIKDKIHLNKMGRERIRYELYKKGIDKNIINKGLSQYINLDEEYIAALELAKKKLDTSYKNDDFSAQYRKLAGFLQRKGYGYEIISKVLDQLLKKNEI